MKQFLVKKLKFGWVEIKLHTKFQLPRMPGMVSFMVGDNNNNNSNKSVEIDASLVPA